MNKKVPKCLFSFQIQENKVLTSTESLKNTCVSVWDSFSTKHPEMTSKQKWCGRCEAIAHNNTNTHHTYHTHTYARNVRKRETNSARPKHDRFEMYVCAWLNEWISKKMPVCMCVYVLYFSYTESIVLKLQKQNMEKEIQSWASRIYSECASSYSWQTCALAVPNVRIERESERKENILHSRSNWILIDQAKQRKRDMKRRMNKKKRTQIQSE